ncbi:MerR family transcriptional regulator [Bacillus sonorensis]|uniref:MerR family transcriptional regulator n=1 Tax=Bacillus sonorensis TaxID=119858 RepID=UPI002282A4FA|nr:MerR family transcriptional regulator [Bacillus sonorensis]MCZ0070332.1 MerR family transcriptional regulator [Bacillus sonorensis]MCZ0097720.1 MerR family transcriptional regulator [Bacillus sonorensis]MEC1518503.1 MerR family transcriptional regulator [Bacillus sonorensis]
MYSVKDVAKLLDLTEHTIRYYTDKGLVPSLQRDKNNNRLFDDKSIDWLIGVKNLKKSGMSVEEIKYYVDLCLEGDSTIQERYAIILKQKELAHQELKEAQKRVEFLEHKAKNYLDIINQKIQDNTNPAKW